MPNETSGKGWGWFFLLLGIFGLMVSTITLIPMLRLGLFALSILLSGKGVYELYQARRSPN